MIKEEKYINLYRLLYLCVLGGISNTRSQYVRDMQARTATARTNIDEYTQEDLNILLVLIRDCVYAFNSELQDVYNDIMVDNILRELDVAEKLVRTTLRR